MHFAIPYLSEYANSLTNNPQIVYGTGHTLTRQLGPENVLKSGWRVTTPMTNLETFL